RAQVQCARPIRGPLGGGNCDAPTRCDQAPAASTAQRGVAANLNVKVEVLQHHGAFDRHVEDAAADAKRARVDLCASQSHLIAAIRNVEAIAERGGVSIGLNSAPSGVFAMI